MSECVKNLTRVARKRFRADSLDGQDTAWVHSYDKVCNRPLDLAKPMWHSCGNDYHVACLYPTAHTALDGSAARAGAIFQLNGCAVRRSGLSVDHGAPCYRIEIFVLVRAGVSRLVAATVSVQTGRALFQTRLESDCLKEARLAFFSEAQLQRQLNVPTVAGNRERAGIGADDSVAIGRIVNEVCAVQDIEKLRPELQIPGFTEKRELGVFVQREVPVEQARTGQSAPPHIAQETRNGRREHVRIEPLVGFTRNDRSRIIDDSIYIALPTQGRTAIPCAGGNVA